MRHRWFWIIAILLAAGCSGTPARPEVQRLVDHYAPGIGIGDRINRTARSRYALQVAPYVGYRDTTYVGPDGVRQLRVHVDEYVDDAAPRVSRLARVTGVNFQLPDTGVVNAVRRRLVSALGTPQEHCHLDPAGPGRPASLLHRLVWSGRGHGVVLGFSYGPHTNAVHAVTADAALGERRGFQSGWVSFAVEPAVYGAGLREIPCNGDTESELSSD
jgi:hypothetical protein